MTAPQFTEIERSILALAQGTLPDSATPFADIAEQAGTDEGTVLELLRRMKENGQIRRFGATLRHQQAGYGSNAMVAWYVEEDKMQAMGERMAARTEISHCYHRRTREGWPFNMYTMIHGRSREDCLRVVAEISRETGLDRYDVLFSNEELKKTSMKYF